MRRLLDFIYEASARVAALMLVGALGMVLAGLVHRNHPLPLEGFDVWAGYLVASAGFLALAHTLKRGDHIRVTALLHSVGPLARRVLEVVSLTVAVGLAGVLAWHAVEMTWMSWLADDRLSAGPDRIPVWVPQLSMSVGALVFCVALIDEWCCCLGARGTEVVSHFDSRV